MGEVGKTIEEVRKGIRLLFQDTVLVLFNSQKKETK